MAGQAGSQIFTAADILSPTPGDKFHLFAALPKELRCQIWTHSLQRQRIIKVRIRSRELMDALLTKYQATRPSEYDGERYGVVVRGYQTISKLFRVCRESREEALLFYRVHLRCWLMKRAASEDAMKPGILYFNPEHDFLSINNDRYIGNDEGQVVDFLHDLKTVHDPCHVGLRNLTIDIKSLSRTSGGFHNIHPAMFNPNVAQSFTETLSQLRQVFFVQIQRLGRHVYSHQSGGLSDENHENLSFPITAMPLNFERLQPDPRPIDQDLGKVFLTGDPRKMVNLWGRLLQDWLGDRKHAQAEQRVLLALSPLADDLNTLQDAEEWYHKSQKSWMKQICMDSQVARVPTIGSEAGVPTALGFWLFPIQAFGPLPKSPHDRLRTEAPRYLDLKAFKPDLGVLSLP